MTQIYEASAFRRVSGARDLVDVQFEDCSFDNCRVSGGTFTNVRCTKARTWSCGLRQVVLRNCTVDGLQMSLGSAGGKTSPLIVFGVLADRLTLRGRIGSLIWNPPYRPIGTEAVADGFGEARTFYGSVPDFALDVTEAEFTAVPSLRYGPPGHLVRHDPGVHQLVTLIQARELLASSDPQLGVWGICLQQMVRTGWPDSQVLIPAVKAPKAQRERDARALSYLRSRLT